MPGIPFFIGVAALAWLAWWGWRYKDYQRTLLWVVVAMLSVGWFLHLPRPDIGRAQQSYTAVDK
jgi:hypothetical protein